MPDWHRPRATAPPPRPRDAGVVLHPRWLRRSVTRSVGATPTSRHGGGGEHCFFSLVCFLERWGFGGHAVCCALQLGRIGALTVCARGVHAALGRCVVAWGAAASAGTFPPSPGPLPCFRAVGFPAGELLARTTCGAAADRAGPPCVLTLVGSRPRAAFLFCAADAAAAAWGVSLSATGAVSACDPLDLPGWACLR